MNKIHHIVLRVWCIRGPFTVNFRVLMEEEGILMKFLKWNKLKNVNKIDIKRIWGKR